MFFDPNFIVLMFVLRACVVWFFVTLFHHSFSVLMYFFGLIFSILDEIILIKVFVIDSQWYSIEIHILFIFSNPIDKKCTYFCSDLDKQHLYLHPELPNEIWPKSQNILNFLPKLTTVWKDYHHEKTATKSIYDQMGIQY